MKRGKMFSPPDPAPGCLPRTRLGSPWIHRLQKNIKGPHLQSEMVHPRISFWRASIRNHVVKTIIDHPIVDGLYRFVFYTNLWSTWGWLMIVWTTQRPFPSQKSIKNWLPALPHPHQLWPPFSMTLAWALPWCWKRLNFRSHHGIEKSLELSRQLQCILYLLIPCFKMMWRYDMYCLKSPSWRWP